MQVLTPLEDLFTPKANEHPDGIAKLTVPGIVEGLVITGATVLGEHEPGIV